MNKPVIEMWALDKLVPYENNAKIHSKEQVKTLAAMIREKGWTSPIQIQKSTGSIIAGHGRRLAAIELGLKQVPVIVLDVSDEDARLLRLSDNRVASTDYDASLITIELSELTQLGMDLTYSGFDTAELDKLTKTDFADLDLGTLTDDIGGAVESQKSDNKARQSEIDSNLSPLGKAFGFNKLAVQQTRRVKAFMAAIETKTGLKGADALMAHIEGVLA